MLPLPSTSRGKPRIFFSSLQSHPTVREPWGGSIQRRLNHLRSRTRLTNLAVVLLSLFLTLSILLNSHYLFSSDDHHPTRRKWDEHTRHGSLNTGGPSSIESTIERDARYTELDHLIVIPGHAIWVGDGPNTVAEDGDWILEPMQKGGSVKTYVRHIQEGVERLKSDSNALLVFSGGATRRPPSPPISESQSYLSLAHALSYLPTTPLPPSSDPLGPLPLNFRATTEEYALDSYENLVFSLARFHEVTGRWPHRVTVVGYGMKRKRFEQLHRAAIGYPAEQFTYVGIDDQGDTTPHYTGELNYGYLPFLSSPSGCHPPLSTKRLLRNPYLRYHPYHTSCPQLVDLLEWCPPYNQNISPQMVGVDVLMETTPVDADGVGIQVFEGHVPWRDGPETVWDRERD